MKHKKSGLDKTSIIMIIVFFAIIVAAVVAIALTSNSRKNPVEEDGNKPSSVDVDEYDDIDEAMDNLTDEEIKQMFPNAKPGETFTYVDEEGNYKTITIPSDYKVDTTVSVTEAVASSKYKFENYTDLSDKFFEVCKAGDIDELYHLYFPGFLEGMRLNMEEVQEKEYFDSGLRSNMLRVTGFAEYEYGSPELSHAGTPASYASFIYSQVNGGKQFPFNAGLIEDCVGLVVYIDNMYETNHFMAKIGGYWYMIV